MLYQAPKKINFLNPSAVVENFNLNTGETVIEFGSGPGFWTIPLAKKVGSKGTVMAIDNQPENLLVIKGKAERAKVNNIKLYKAPYSSKEIPLKEKGDLILFSNILSLSKSWKTLLANASKNAKKGTRMVVIDWNVKKFLFGRNSLKNWTEDIIIEARKSGFEFKRLLPVGDFHFGLYFEYQGEN